MSRTPKVETAFRRKGMLAFLDDAAVLFPYDADVCKKQVSTAPRRPTRRRRRAPKVDETDEASALSPVLTENTTLSEKLRVQRPRVVVLFFCDPEQIYSTKVRNRILQVLHYGDGTTSSSKDHVVDGLLDTTDSACSEIMCCAVTLGGDESSSSYLGNHHYGHSAMRGFLRATGILQTRVASSMALHNVFLPRVQGYPHVMLINAANGQAFGGHHEELALEWNSAETVRQRWIDGQSGLDCAQQSLSNLLFPASCVIL